MTEPSNLTEREKLQRAIAAQESLRGIVEADIIDATVAALQEKLTAFDEQPVRQQRKQVTVLFMDVVGSTQMIHNLDPEDNMAILDLALKRFAGPIESHGGRVLRFMGDGFLAIFGAPIARENDPEMAIRAGLAIIALAEEHARDIKQRWEISEFKVRLGLDTGAVVVGGHSEGGDTVMGSTVNLAARLESAAPPGGLLISQHTYQLVQGLFDVEAQAPIQAKGFPDPVPVYLVQKARHWALQESPRGIEGSETPLVGRAAETDILRGAFNQAVETSDLKVVTIVGDAGIGKSRLIFEFEKWLGVLGEGVQIYRARGRQEMQGVPYSLLRDLFSFYFQIQDDDPVDIVRTKMEMGISQRLQIGEDVVEKAHFVGQTLGFNFNNSPHLEGMLDDPRQIRERGLRYLVAYLYGVSSRNPTVIFLEDIHWADDASLDLINRVTAALKGVAVLIIAVARPSLYRRQLTWGVGQDFHQSLDLGPLSQGESRRLVEEALHYVPDLPEILWQTVVRNAEGNPFYLEELIKKLIEDGVILKKESEWIVHSERLADLHLPSTLTGILQARLDNLPKTERTVLQQASVVGRVFWDAVLVHINQVQNGSGLKAGAIEHDLAELRSKEMVFRRDLSTFTEARELIFKHAILREVVYESVLKSKRRSFHKLVADWLIEIAGERVREYTGVIADHLALANEMDMAFAYLRRAGEEAAAGYANEEAARYFSRAIKLAPVGSEQTCWELNLALEKIHDLLGHRPAQLETLETLENLAAASEDANKLATVALCKANYLAVTGDYPASIKFAQETARLSKENRSIGLEVKAFLRWGQTAWLQRDYDAAQLQLGLALSSARAEEMQDDEAESLRNLGIVAELQGEYELAKAYYDDALLIFRALGDLQGEGNTVNNYGLVLTDQGEFGDAIDCYTEAHKIFKQIGDRQGESKVTSNLGILTDNLGDHAEAKKYFKKSLEIRVEIGDRQGESNSLYNLGYARHLLGDFAGAKNAFEKALVIFRSVGDSQGESLALESLGLIACDQNELDRAMDLCQSAVRIAEGLGDRSTHSTGLTTLGHIYLALKDFPAAEKTYNQALEIRETLGQTKLTLEPRAGLVRALGAQGDLPSAQAHVSEILKQFEAGVDLHGTREPIRIYMTCIQILEEMGDPRKSDLVVQAYQALQERAAKIPDEGERQVFIESVPWHQDLLDRYQDLNP